MLTVHLQYLNFIIILTNVKEPEFGLLMFNLNIFLILTMFIFYLTLFNIDQHYVLLIIN